MGSGVKLASGPAAPRRPSEGLVRRCCWSYWYVRFDGLLELLAVAWVCAWSFVCAAAEFDGRTYQAHTTA